MNKKKWSILIIILVSIGILAGICQCISPKVSIVTVNKGIQNIPLTLEQMELVLTGVDKKKYLTRDKMIARSKKAIAPFIHNEDCRSNCKADHLDRYETESAFDRLDKKLEIRGMTSEIPYTISLHNRKDGEYHLYYEMVIPLLEQQEKLPLVQKRINKVDKAWGVEVMPSIYLIGSLEGELTKEEKESYANEILKELNAYKKDYYKVSKDEEEIYYGYIRYFKEYERNEEGNKFNVMIKFIFNPETKQTQLTLKLPTKI